MLERRDAPLAPLTTLKLGGPAARLVEARTEAELAEAVRSAYEPLLVLAGGSNVVVADAGFPGTVVLVRTRGRSVDRDDSGAVSVTVAAGEDWDDLVGLAVAEGWTGVEALSGIPGRCGAVPIQNVGAYGQEVSETIVRVHAYDRIAGAPVTLPATECGFGYRTSRFKRQPDRFVVLQTTFRFGAGSLSGAIAYAELARCLGIAVGGRAPLQQVRESVLALRRGKGMVLDAADRDTWSAGSFFTNPVLTPQAAVLLPPTAPRWQQPDGRIKTSAAWLIEHAGFNRGYGTGPARVSSKHTLALSNQGGATTAQLLELAREIRDGVRERFGIELVNEPVLVGAEL